MEKQLTPQHRQAIVPVLGIFKVRSTMRISEINNRYAKAFGKNFAPRQFGFKNMNDLATKLGIFEHSRGEEIAISSEKLLELTVKPLLVGNKVGDNFEEEFFQFNGFQFSVLCKHFEVSTVEEMLKSYFTHNQLDEATKGTTVAVLQTTWSPNTASVCSEDRQKKATPSLPKQPSLNSSRQRCHMHMLPSPLPMLEQTKPRVAPSTSTFIPPVAAGPFLSPASLPKHVTRQFPLPVATSFVEAGSKGDMPPHFPNNQMSFADESYLPPIPIARPDMETYQPPRSLVAPTFSAHDSPEKVKTKLDGYIQNFISVFSSKGKHLPASLVTNEAKAKLQKASQYCNIRFCLRDIPSCSKFDTRYKRICEFIRAFCWNCSTCSLFDLQRTIVKFEEVSSFAELQMGPILKHPLIKDFFKPGEAVNEVPEITAYDIQLTVKKFIDSSPKGAKFKLEEFMEFFAKRQSVKSPNDLCIRIASFPLAISSNLKFRTTQKLTRERLQATIEEKMEEVVEFEVSNMKRKLSRTSEQKYLLEKDPALLLQEVFACAIPLCEGRLHSHLSMFFDIVVRNRSFRKLFQLAIYQGAYGIKKTVKEAEEHHQSMQAMFSAQQGIEVMNYKSPGEILHNLLPCLKSLPFPVDLASLAQTEADLMDTFGVGKFSSLGQGPFLSFVANQPRVIEALGGRAIGSTNDSEHLRTKRMRAVSFMKQLKDMTDKEEVSKLITRQFCVGSVQELGCGSVDKLLSDTSQLSQSVNNSLFFELPLLLNQSGQDSLEFKEGVLGPQTSRDALFCLQKAPLLEDLASWSHWDSVYAPSLGSLSRFLVSLPADHSLHALEVAPRVLLKVCPSSTTQDFIGAVQTLNAINTAGHLVSMAVKAGSAHQVPTQLLAKQFQSKLEEMVAIPKGKQDNRESPAHFVFCCIVRIPVELCAVLGKEVFIEPLRKVTSAAMVDGMLEYCHNFPRYRHHLQALGMRIGIKAWSDDYREMLQEGGKVKEIASLGGGRFPAVIRKSAASLADQPPLADDKITTSSNSPSEGYQDTTDSTVTDNTGDSEEPVIIISPNFSPEELAQRELACKQVVDSIRKEEFGVGVKLDRHQKKIAEKQREREGRGLARLSKELYSKDTHFVLELVQNADDNSYPPHLHSICAVPTLKFILTSKCITVLNNEVGFSEKNVRAICDVGRSTKDPCRAGYIGQKGIGFKSVFRVTDKPEIHSNGFHIQFDTKSGPIGYILPHWKSVSCNEEAICDQELTSWMTRIVLPLKAESSLSLSLVNKFQDIHPSLLLFLNRLRCIIVEDRDSQELRKMQRSDKKNEITEIAHDSGIDRWLVVRKQMEDASQYKPGVEATELALAFPLPENLKSPPSARELKTQQVFAFLPLRSYGFRFIVQGDFDLPSSREDVNTDSAWNQWLREEVPSLFLEAADKMKVLSEVTDVEAMVLYMQFVPLEGEVHDFFRPVAGQILQLLRGQECLPTNPFTKEADSNAFQVIINNICLVEQQESEVQWKQPSKLLRVTNDLVWTHIPQPLLSLTLGLHYLHRDLHSAISPDLCSQLGIGIITIDHLIAVAEVVLKSFEKVENKTWLFNDAGEDDSLLDGNTNLSPWSVMVQWIAQWLACVHRIMEETRSISAATLQDLRRLEIIPLTNHSLVSLDSGAVFFPPMTTIKEFQGFFGPIYNELRIIDADLLKSEDKIIPVMVMKLLSLKLGVKELQTADVIRHHILPCFQANKVTKEKLQISYLAYIKHGIDGGAVPEPEMVAALKDNVLLHTNHGAKNPNREVVHFSSEYKSRWDLCRMFPGIRWTVVSPKYLAANPSVKGSKSDPTGWKEFLLHLGVQSAIAIERINQSIDPASKGEQGWSNFSEWKRSPDSKYIVRDYASKEFDDIVNSVKGQRPQVRMEQMKTLAELIDSSWSSGQEYKKYMLASYYDGSNSTELGQTHSSFAVALSTKVWLPAVDLEGRPYQTNLAPGCLYKGCNLFQQSDINKRLLHSHVPYIGAQLRDYSLIKHLQLKDDISSKDLLDFLREWSKSSIEKGYFTTSLDHMHSVYLFLRRKSEEEEDTGDTAIRDSFSSEKLIFVPLDSKTRQQDKDGKFYSVHDVCWADNSTVLYKRLKDGEPVPDHLPKVLSYYYYSADGVIKHTFSYFGVSRFLKMQWLVDLLEFNASFSPTVEPREAQTFRTIVEEIIKPSVDSSQQDYEAEHHFNPTSTDMFVYEKLKRMKIFPSKSRKWVSLEKLFIDDAPDVSKCFDSSKIDFLLWPNNSGRESVKEIPHHLVEVCHIPLLSSCYSKEFAPGQTRPYLPLQESMHYMVPVIQRFICAKFPQLYETLQNQQGIDEYLRRLQFFSVIELNCIYSVQLPGRDIRSEAVSLKGYSLHDDPQRPVMYAVVNDMGKVAEKRSLVRELQTIFFKDMADVNETSTFLNDLVLDDLQSENDQISFMESHQLVQQLPTGATEWHISLPNIPSQPLINENLMGNSQETIDSGPKEGEEHDLGEPVLKAWPPNSSVHMAKGEETGAYGRGVGRATKRLSLPHEGDDIVTLDDVQKMKGEEEARDVKLNSLASSATCTPRPMSNLSNSDSGRPPSQGFPRQLSTASISSKDQQEQLIETAATHNPFHGTTQAKVVGKVIEDKEMTHAQKQVVASSHSHGPSNPMKAPNFTNVESVDLSSLMQAVEMDLEHVFVPDNQDSSTKMEVGRWGEQFIYSYLKNKQTLPDQTKIISINWVNEQAETGYPYDMEVQVSNKQTLFIEVKSTSTPDKAMIPTSWNELHFAQEKGKSYLLFRVYNAGKTASQVRIKWLQNLFGHIETHSVRFFITL